MKQGKKRQMDSVREATGIRLQELSRTAEDRTLGTALHHRATRS